MMVSRSILIATLTGIALLLLVSGEDGGLRVLNRDIDSDIQDADAGWESFSNRYDQAIPAVAGGVCGESACSDDAICYANFRQMPCFQNDGREPDERHLIVANGDPNMPNPDDKATFPQYQVDDTRKPPPDGFEPDEKWWLRDICMNQNSSLPPDMDDPRFDMFFDVPGEREDGGIIRPPGDQPGPLEDPPPKDPKKPKKRNKRKERRKNDDERSLQSSSDSHYDVVGISTTEIRVNVYLTAWALAQINTYGVFDLCWKKKGTFAFSICNKNIMSILPGNPGVDDLGMDVHGHQHYRIVVSEDQGTNLVPDTEYKFKIFLHSGWQMSPLWGKTASTLPAPLCNWGDSITAFSGQYVIQNSQLEKTDGTCVLHRGDFNGDDKTDILRTCDDLGYNALWWGGGGFTPYGYIYTTSHLQNSDRSCVLHIADFNGDTHDDLLRTCNDPNYNYLAYGNSGVNPFIGYGYVIQGSVLNNYLLPVGVKLHIGDFNGDGRMDLLRTSDLPFYNALWYGEPGYGGFSGQGYQLQSFLFQNSYNDCRVHVGDFDGDDKDDVLRSCDNPTLNRLIKGTATGFGTPTPVLTGSVLEKKNKTCRLHLADYNDDDKIDLLRTCDDPTYNYIFYGALNPFTGGGYVLQGSLLQNSGNTCRLHVGDYNEDGNADLFRSCDSRCYNALYLRNTGGTSFTGGAYTLTTSVLENSVNQCKLHIGDYNGDDHVDFLRTCNDRFYNALFQSIL